MFGFSILSIAKYSFIALFLMISVFVIRDVIATYEQVGKLKAEISILNSVVTEKNQRITFLENDILQRERLLEESKNRELRLEREMNEILENLDEDSEDQAPQSIKDVIRQLGNRKNEN